MALSSVPWTDSQTNALEITCRVCSALSIVGCLFVFTTFISSSKFRKPVSRIIFCAIWGNFLFHIANAISIPAIQAGVDSPLCQFQAFLIQWTAVVDALWALSLAINVYLTVFKRYSADQLRPLEKWYILFNYGTTFILAFVPIFISTSERGSIYGSATYWCWISMEWDFLRIALLYAPVWIILLGVFVLYVAAGIHLHVKRRELKAFDQSAQPLASTLRTTEVKITSEKCPKKQEQINKDTIIDIEKATRLGPKNLQDYEPYTVAIGTDLEEQGIPVPSNEIPASGPVLAETDAALRQANAAVQNATNAAWSYTRRAGLFFSMLLVAWVATTINRVYTFVHPDTVSFGLAYASVLLLPLMGLFNTITYAVSSWEAVKAIPDDFLSACIDMREACSSCCCGFQRRAKRDSLRPSSLAAAKPASDSSNPYGGIVRKVRSWGNYSVSTGSGGSSSSSSSTGALHGGGGGEGGGEGSRASESGLSRLVVPQHPSDDSLKVLVAPPSKVYTPPSFFSSSSSGRNSGDRKGSNSSNGSNGSNGEGEGEVGGTLPHSFSTAGPRDLRMPSFS